MRQSTASLIAAFAAATLLPIDATACTNLLVGKKASADGSTMISYAADSHTLYGELYYTPAADHAPGSTRRIVEWDTQRVLGEIPEVAHTYRVVGNMNEHQVTIAESTWGGDPSLQDTTALIDYGSLIYIALERAATAREAISIMTDLVAEYGYYSSGESFSVGDPDEIWVLEMIGKGVGNKGAVWVAQRIPDDCISGHANQSRIHKFPLRDKKTCLYSKDVISFARQRGLYAGRDEDFDFSAAYGEHDYLAYRGCDGRVWAYFNRYASGMDRYFPFVDAQEGAEVMPLYVKPDRPLTHRDVQAAMRDHFEGTPWDMTQDVGGGPYHCPYRFRPLTWRVDSVEYLHERAIATQQTGFVFVAQMRGWLPDAVGAKTWFGVDDANTAVFTPIYNNVTEAPECFRVGNGDLLTFSWTSAFWMNNWVANQAYARYDRMIGDIAAVRDSLEDRFDRQQAEVDSVAHALHAQSSAAATRYLTEYSAREANGATAAYRDLGIYLLVKYLDGNEKRERDGHFERTPEGLAVDPAHPAYSDDFYRAIVRQRGDALKVK
jgi:dipeptidase